MNRFIGERRQKAIRKERNFGMYNMESGSLPRGEAQTIITKIIRIKK